MPRHYLKFSAQLEDYARKVRPQLGPDWAREVFLDVTESGKVLCLESLESNERGYRVGLCGDHFYCEAGRDSARPDALFVFRIEAATRRLPKSPPARVVGDFRLIAP